MINKIYLNNFEKIKATFQKEGSITFIDFFQEDFFKILQKDVETLNFKKEKDPTAYSYSQANYLFRSKEFSKFVKKLSGRNLRRPIAYLFEWKDYTILNDQIKSKTGVDIVFDLTEYWQPEWGGMIIYSDGEGKYIQITPNRNSLTIIKRRGRKFVKYLNNKSQGRRYILMF
ncbi:MAG: hypothetical protein A2639_01960 [Candidatus Staskawiczbacteria bacterium RIFCSPHIGHO2_01_FULL_34_27]|uniref:Uncharacterized protein n=1 Tax=Candidatus Staskawiczbacteria bacterium RIFCSPHIGHO2_01_FULL_34_27 TaxID=1802199 RepID=A0A1G2HJX2_9BACT|nr:MAG: hypothetical protein A2639_01960 [Candidatus Staskawiczbacteria bacterium RIFCSPHIGHO2_01_FULL_34_27]